MGYLIRKVDSNQNEIVSCLRKMGVRVAVLSSFGNGFPDLVCSVKGKLWLVELKSKKNSKLTECEKKFHETWGDHICIISSIDQAIEFVNSKL